MLNSEEILKELNTYIIVKKPSDDRNIEKVWIQFDKEGETTEKEAYNDYVDQRVDGLVKEFIEQQNNKVVPNKKDQIALLERLMLHIYRPISMNAIYKTESQVLREEADRIDQMNKDRILLEELIKQLKNDNL